MPTYKNKSSSKQILRTSPYSIKEVLPGLEFETELIIDDLPWVERMLNSPFFSPVLKSIKLVFSSSIEEKQVNIIDITSKIFNIKIENYCDKSIQVFFNDLSIKSLELLQNKEAIITNLYYNKPLYSNIYVKNTSGSIGDVILTFFRGVPINE